MALHSWKHQGVYSIVAFLSLLLGGSGCKSTAANVVVSGAAPSAELASIQQKKSIPSAAWVAKFKKVRALYRKDKQKLVDLLGEPNRVLDSLYYYDSPSFSLMCGSDAWGINLIDVAVPTGTRLEDLWTILGAPGKEPKQRDLQYDVLKSFWQDREPFRVQPSKSRGGLKFEYAVRYMYEITHYEVLYILAVVPEPPTEGTIKFSTKTNQRELVDQHPNPRYRWQDARVYSLRICKFDPEN